MNLVIPGVSIPSPCETGDLVRCGGPRDLEPVHAQRVHHDNRSGGDVNSINQTISVTREIHGSDLGERIARLGEDHGRAFDPALKIRCPKRLFTHARYHVAEL